MNDNVLLHLGEEPRFDAIQTADIKPALQTAIAEARAQIDHRARRQDLGRGIASQLRRRYARTARRL